MSMNSIRGVFSSYYNVRLSHEYKMEVLANFFQNDRTFNFRKGYGDPQGTILFLDFFPFVNDENKEAFLRNVWAAFAQSQRITGKHPWAPIEGPLFGWDAFAQEGRTCKRTRLFREGFLKYEACLVTRKPDFGVMVHTNEYWWRDNFEFVEEVIEYGSAENSLIFLKQFYLKLKQINNLSIDNEEDAFRELKKGVELKSLEKVLQPLISVSGLTEMVFRRMHLHLLVDGIVSANLGAKLSK